jgi:peptidoglycan/LPS O-acetylase OafA/YrhL
VSQTADPTLDKRPAGIGLSAAYSPELEALRGWAILMVFLFHADGAVLGVSRIGTTVSPALAFITAGHSGVTLFFILSAFLLARPFLEEGFGRRRVDRTLFYRRRILRIMPLYATAVAFAVYFNFRNADAVIEGFYAITFLNSITGTPGDLIPFSAVWWSLATEVQFYLALPLLGLCLRSRVGRAIGLATLVFWGVAYAAVALDPSLTSNALRFRLNLSIFGRAPAFLFGIGAAWLVVRQGDRIRTDAQSAAWMRNGGADLVLLATLFCLGVVLQYVTRYGFNAAETQIPAWHLIESFLWTLVVVLVVLAPLRLGKLISNRATGTLGLLSYSLYLVHEPILYLGLGPLVRRGIPVDAELTLRIAAFALAFVLCVALSALTYRFIERPFLVRKARIGR